MEKTFVRHLRGFWTLQEVTRQTQEEMHQNICLQDWGLVPVNMQQNKA